MRFGWSSESAPSVSGAKGIRGSHRYNFAHDLAGTWFPIREGGNNEGGGLGVRALGGGGLIPETLTSPSYVFHTR